jgi:hypothetical protein
MWLAEQTRFVTFCCKPVEVADLIFQLMRGKHFYIYLRYLCVSCTVYHRTPSSNTFSCLPEFPLIVGVKLISSSKGPLSYDV